MEIQARFFLNSALERSGWLDSGPGHLTLGEVDLLRGTLRELHSRSGRYGEERSVVVLPALDPRFVGET